MRKLEGDFDYIVVGAGTAGCIMANRLSADPNHRVLILEAGGNDNWIWFHIPVGYLFAIGNPRSDWMFKTEPEEGLNGRSLNYPRGKVIGGSSSINAMIYMRGQAADYDHWRQLGNQGWSYEDVLPFFKKAENNERGASEHHGAGGPVNITRQRSPRRLNKDFLAACEAAGIPRTRDCNGPEQDGATMFQVTQRDGRRWSAADAFLTGAAPPALRRLISEGRSDVERAFAARAYDTT